MDEGSFNELSPSAAGTRDDPGAAANVVAGWGTIHGRKTYTFFQDDSLLGHPGASAPTRLLTTLMSLARQGGSPLVTLHAATGARVENSVASLAAYGELLDQRVGCSGLIPQVCCVLGRWLGGSSHGAALSDLTICVEGSTVMHMSSPHATQAVTGESVTDEELGGAHTLSVSGTADLVVPSVEEALELARYALSFLPDNNLQSPPYFPPEDEPDRPCAKLERLIPDSPNVPYDVLEVLADIVDDGELLETKPRWGTNVVTAFARLDGYPIGIVANQPMSLAGTLDITSSTKGAGFVQLCDAFNVPLLAFVDTPGFRPGVQEEFRGIIRHGAKLVYAFAEATVPKITLIARKAYGGAYIVMNSRHIRADLSLAWPSGEIAVMGAEGATKIIHRKEIAGAGDPKARETELISDYRGRFSNPYIAAERGFVDDVIAPADTRRRLVSGFEILRGKREMLPQRKHSNIPL